MTHRYLEGGGEPHGETGGILRGCRALPGECQWQPDDHLEGVEFCGDRHDPGDVAVAARHSLDRGSEHAVKVTAGDADTNRADVDPETYA